MGYNKMTEARLLIKLRELQDVNSKAVNKMFKHLMDSGAINLDDWLDSYELPKAMMAAMCEELSWQWRPLTEHLKAFSKELRRHL